MTLSSPRTWRRREWLLRNTQAAVTASTFGVLASPSSGPAWFPFSKRHPTRAIQAQVEAHTARMDLDPAAALAQRAIESARAAGANYADARVTRIVIHNYDMAAGGRFLLDDHLVGIGVRALVNGYWGFAASPFLEPDEVAQLARDAVAQAKANVLRSPRVVELGHVPVATGTWATPITIDPFTVPIEEKLNYIRYWQDCALRAGLQFQNYGLGSYFQFARQERLVATSDGALFTQTMYESGGAILLEQINQAATGQVQGISITGQGWERLLDAHIPEQFPHIFLSANQSLRLSQKAATVGRYTVVCDGATMAALVDRTWGLATQLDRALGYEANADGTSILTAPLDMLGTLQVASPLVTVTANRSTPTQLATAKWDDEGVETEPFALIEKGTLVDFQTTREQSAWLAPYYERHQRPVRSRGCAAAESALAVTMQHMPNLELTADTNGGSLSDLVNNVTNGILIENGAAESDFQVSGGMIQGSMREIRQGRLGRQLVGGAVYFSTIDLWKNVTAVGNASTQATRAETQYLLDKQLISSYKGQPAQATSHSATAVAATIQNQPIIELGRKG